MENMTPDPRQAAGPDAASAAPAAPPKVRRVGTFTFGAVLVTAGALLLAYILLPGFDLLAVARFAPVILIALGVEVLIYAARPDIKLRYDFLSMLACAFILLLVGGASILPRVWQAYGPPAEERYQQFVREIERTVYQEIEKEEDLAGVIMKAHFSLSYRAVDEGTTFDNCTGPCYAYIEMGPVYASREDFAADCRRIAAACAKTPVTELDFHGSCSGQEGTKSVLTLGISMPWQKDADIDTLSRLVEESADAEDGSASADDLEQARAEGYDEGYTAGYEQALLEDRSEGDDAGIADDQGHTEPVPESLEDPEDPENQEPSGDPQTSQPPEAAQADDTV